MIFIYEVAEISKSPKFPYFNHGGVTTAGHCVSLLQEARECAQDPREEKDKGKESLTGEIEVHRRECKTQMCLKTHAL